MQRFLKNLLLALLPIVFITILYFTTDPFKVIFSYSSYYSGRDFVSLNRALVNTRLYKQNRGKMKYNSFIFGSSRSIAFQANEWKRYLPNDDVAFHFDGNAETIYGINAKMKYINKQGDRIKNALIIVDDELLDQVSNCEEPIYVNPPEISDIGYIKFHLMYFKSFLNPKFFYGYFDFLIFHKYRTYMGGKFLNLKYHNKYDQKTSDVIFGMEVEIQNDSVGYYSNLQKNINIFLKNKISDTTKFMPANIEKAKILLKEMKYILDKHHTDYKIIVNPLITQKIMNPVSKNMLTEIFQGRVYDFSGKNKFTTEIGNYYDISHYRPAVARNILNIIYNN